MSPFVAAFLEADSFEEAAKIIAGTVAPAEHDPRNDNLRIESLLPEAIAVARSFKPGPCTTEVLCNLRSDLSTPIARHQHMRYLHDRNTRTKGYALICSQT